MEQDTFLQDTFLIVGAGSIGRRHLRNLRALAPNSRIIVFRRTDDGAIPEADAVATDLDRAIAEKPSAAIIANPAPFHVSVARRLADAGCHLLVEKPLSDTLDGVDALIRTCEARKLVLMAGYNLRFMPSLRKAVDLLAAGAIGKILHVRADVGQYLPDWRPGTDYRDGITARLALGGGALLELSHEIDLMSWIAGPIKAVMARMRRIGNLDIETEDCVDLVFDFSGGASGTAHLDLLQRIPQRSVRVIGSEGTLEWDYFADAVRFRTPDMAEWQTADSPKIDDRNAMYRRELEVFLESAKEGRTDQPLTNGRDVMAVIAAARRSDMASGARIEVECARC